MKILIIEDDPIQAVDLKIQLRALGYKQVDTATNMHEVALLTTDNSFDLVFCDIHLPDTDGVTLLSEHLNSKMVKAVVVISVVADSILHLTTGMCRQLGYRFVSTMKKPLSRDALSVIMQNYEARLQETQHAQAAIQISEDDIREAFENDRFFSVYQPQFSFDTSELVGVEALVRMEHPEFGIVSPFYFLSQINQMGKMMDLYSVMLEKATKAVCTLGGDAKLSLNITQDLLEKDLTEITTKICATNEFPLTQLTLELTEEQAYNTSHRALANIAKLSINGVTFSIDDFGTGFASLEKLVDLPFSELKIDRTFVSRMKDSYRHQQITMSAVRLAQSLGLHCVAEGVEDLGTWTLLKDLEVDTCQGFYTGNPVPISDLLPLYQAATKQDASTRENLGVVVYVDSDSTRGLAMQKLLSRGLVQFNVMLCSKLEELNTFIRDLPTSMIVIDADALPNKTSKTTKETFEGIDGVESVVLVSNEYQGKHCISNMPYIVKGETIKSTISKVMTLLVSS